MADTKMGEHQSREIEPFPKCMQKAGIFNSLGLGGITIVVSEIVEEPVLYVTQKMFEIIKEQFHCDYKDSTQEG